MKWRKKMTKLNIKDSFLSATLHLVECKRQITELCVQMEDEERAVDMDTLDDVRIEIENSILPMLVDLQERAESVEKNLRKVDFNSKYTETDK
jgi:hypothetical protein